MDREVFDLGRLSVTGVMTYDVIRGMMSWSDGSIPNFV